jgi:serralysin
VIEYAGEGFEDRVYSSLDYMLPANVEILFLTGSAAISGTGNDLANAIFGNNAGNVLTGGMGTDQLQGGGGDDELWGEADNDTLEGGPDNDVLVGGAGRDWMRGGTGVDRFYFRDPSDSGFAGAAADWIVDFSSTEGDKIDLSGMDANTTILGDQVFTFIGNNNPFFGAGQVRFNGGFVEGDLDGDLNADFRIEVFAPSLVESDFYL